MKRNEIEQIIYVVLNESLAMDTNGIDATDELTKLNVDTDDWTFSFIPDLQERLGVSVPAEEWSNVSTVSEIVEMLLPYIKESPPTAEKR